MQRTALKRFLVLQPKKTAFLLFLLLAQIAAMAQWPYGISDGRENGSFCQTCAETIESKPPEVLFGIFINSLGEIFFSMDNTDWFDKIFPSNAFGVTVDLVSKDRYKCNDTETFNDELPKGTVLFPVYRNELEKGKNRFKQGSIYVKIGKLPPALKNKQVEGNLVIVNGNQVCYYSNFVNIERNAWQLLPMGLFTDTLVQQAGFNQGDNKTNWISYTRKMQLEIPFQKAGAQVQQRYQEAIYDSVRLARYRVRRVEIRAYSSVEGPEQFNKQLMQQRADAIVETLKKYGVKKERAHIRTAENWMDFYRAIEGTPFAPLASEPKQSVKQKLADNHLLQQIEPLLAQQRKAVVTLYLDEKTTAAEAPPDSLVQYFNKAVVNRNDAQARSLMKELAEQIADNNLPQEYMYRLEIPESIEYGNLLNDREVYKYRLNMMAEEEMLENLLRIRQLDPKNGSLNYNICALRFFTWQQFGDTAVRSLLPAEIAALPAMGIHDLLVKRLYINYHILKSEEDLQAFNYAGKDSSVTRVREYYRDLPLFDDDLYSMARYFSYHAHNAWAEELITPRINKIDVDEHLLFYYLNLMFFYPHVYGTETFKTAMVNAAILNRQRFCAFFLPISNGGASMQLLDDDRIKEQYCQWCK